MAGALVAGTPPLWYSLAWEEHDSGIGAGGWLFLAAFSFAPFLLLGALRGGGAMGRIAALATLLACAALVILGQVSGLNPDDPSSTAAISVVVVPVNTCILVALVLVVERLLRGAVSLVHSRRSRGPSRQG